MAKKNNAPVEHSKMFDHIKELYDSGEWSKKWVKNAVVKGKIRADEYKEITGEDYE